MCYKHIASFAREQNVRTLDVPWDEFDTDRRGNQLGQGDSLSDSLRLLQRISGDGPLQRAWRARRGGGGGRVPRGRS